MATNFIETALSSPTKYNNAMRKVQTIIPWMKISIGGLLGCTLSQQDMDQTFVVEPSQMSVMSSTP